MSHRAGNIWAMPPTPTHRARIPREVALRPRLLLAMPAVRARIEEIQRELLDELHSIDEQVQSLIWRRQAVVAELRRCRDGLGHAGTHWKRQPLPGDVDAEPEGTIAIGGPDLRRVVAEIVHGAGKPVDINEIYRMLLAGGHRPAGRFSQAISNALRPEVAAGRILRLDRGLYAPREPGA